MSLITLKEQAVQREIDELLETIAAMERLLAESEPWMDRSDIQDAEFHIEELDYRVCDLETELCRLQDRSFFDLLMEGDPIIRRTDDEDWNDDVIEEFSFAESIWW